MSSRNINIQRRDEVNRLLRVYGDLFKQSEDMVQDVKDRIEIQLEGLYRDVVKLRKNL